MPLNFETEAPGRFNRFKRLGTWYILALSLIATVAIAGQILIQRHLKSQLSDSRIINVAGKQRMLSQRISKTVLLLTENQPAEARIKILTELQLCVPLWSLSQRALLNGNDSLGLSGINSPVIIALFAKVSDHFTEMHQSTSHIISRLQKMPMAWDDSLKSDVKNILAHETPFLTGMENIVFQYANEAQEKVSTLSNLEYLLLGVTLLIISLEIIFIFKPTTEQVNKTINKLLESEKKAKTLTKEVIALYASLEKSYEQISHISQPVDNPRLIAKSDKGGTVLFISSYFSELAGKELLQDRIQLCELFDGLEHPNDWMDEVIDTVSEGRFWQGEIFFKDSMGKDCWMELNLVPTFDSLNQVAELMLMGSDITLRKTAEQNLNKKTRAEIDKRINQQKFRSVLILEGQEEERKRIAMDIHDGIGQMLSSLKFQIESINLNEHEKASSKIAEIKLMTKQLIKEARRITFNLKPTVLGDYGLQAALKVFTNEIEKLIDIKLTFKSDGEISRLSQQIENNIFRIIQEAINNAIKYSGAKSIEISLQHDEHELVIIVNDEGKGFNERILESRNVNIESGRGFFNMYERTEYVNGSLEIKSQPGKGTRVTLTVPLHSAVLAE